MDRTDGLGSGDSNSGKVRKIRFMSGELGVWTVVSSWTDGTAPVWLKSYYETGHGATAQPVDEIGCRCCICK